MGIQLATILHNFRCGMVSPHATIPCDCEISMSSSRKKVVARKSSQEWVSGYLPASGFSRLGAIEMLGLDGKILSIKIQELKWISFVRDFNSGELKDPERMLRKTFAGRPRGDGLWVRLRFADGDQLEGLAENNMGLLDADGFFLTPPDTRGNTQRLWISRAALVEFEIASVIGAAKKKPPSSPKQEAQETLFPVG